MRAGIREAVRRGMDLAPSVAGTGNRCRVRYSSSITNQRNQSGVDRYARLYQRGHTVAYRGSDLGKGFGVGSWEVGY